MEENNSNYTYVALKVIGYGAFGVVYEVKVNDTDDKVAIKKILQDKRFKNRELQILKDLQHPNIVTLKNAFYTSGNKPEELYLNIVMDYIPDNLVKVMKEYAKRKEFMPYIMVKLYAWQMFRALT